MGKHSTWNKDVFGKDLENTGLDKLELQADLILAQAKLQTPVDEGPLRDSGKVARDNQNHCVWISFGSGPSKKYAIMQHERTDLHHDDGKAKYLEDPFNEMKDAALKEALTVLKG